MPDQRLLNLREAMARLTALIDAEEYGLSTWHRGVGEAMTDVQDAIIRLKDPPPPEPTAFEKWKDGVNRGMMFDEALALAWDAGGRHRHNAALGAAAEVDGRFPLTCHVPNGWIRRLS